jgi:ABC-2 type transport system ATP-binding protein
MLQRLGLASVVVSGPDLLLLDEPAAALDPGGRREVLDMVADLRGDATVVFSSHILDDVQEVCDTVGILRRGSLVYEGSLEQLVAGTDRLPAYEIAVRGDAPAVADLLRSCDWAADVSVDGRTIRVTARSSAVMERELVRCVARANTPIVSIEPVRRSLEDVFLEVTS